MCRNCKILSFGTQRSDFRGRNTKCLHFKHPNGRGGRLANSSEITLFCAKSQKPVRIPKAGPPEAMLALRVAEMVRIPLNSIEFLGIPGNSNEFHWIPLDSEGFQ